MFSAGGNAEGQQPYDIVSKGLDKMWQIFIQPDRSLFDKSRLGGGRFRVDPNPAVYTRTDGKCPNLRGEELEYTLLQAEQRDPSMEGCCVIYLHSHGSSRAEGLGLLQSVALHGLDMCLFDFAGSGYSGGEYCSLGIREAGDIKIILDCLRIRHSKSRFVLYGRSMGAVATIFLASQAPAGLEMLILDSPFCDVEQLVQDLGRHYAGGLGGIVGIAFFNSVQDEISKRLGFDPSIIKPIQVCHQIRIPTIIIGGAQDEMVSLARLEEMLQALSSKEKSILKVDGSHSAARPPQLLDAIMKKAKEKFSKAVLRDLKEQENEQELLLEKVEINTIPSFQSKVSFLSKKLITPEKAEAGPRLYHQMITPREPTGDDLLKSYHLDARKSPPKSVKFDMGVPQELRGESGAKTSIQVPESTAPNLILTEKEELDAMRWRPPQIFSQDKQTELGQSLPPFGGFSHTGRDMPGIFDSPRPKPLPSPVFSPILKEPEKAALHKQLAESICLSPTPYASVLDHGPILNSQKENLLPRKPSASWVSDPFLQDQTKAAPKQKAPILQQQPQQRLPEPEFYDPFASGSTKQAAKPVMQYPQPDGYQFEAPPQQQSYWPGFS